MDANILSIFSTVPVQSMPPGATHRLRVWLKSLVPLTTNPALSQPLPFNDSFIYHRIYKTDDFKVGGRLEFNALGNRLVMAFPRSGGPETINMRRAPTMSRDQAREKDLESIPEKNAMFPTSQYSHYLPPGAQHPAHPAHSAHSACLLDFQATHADLGSAHYQSRSPDPTLQQARLQPLRAASSREQVSLSRAHKSRVKIV